MNNQTHPESLDALVVKYHLHPRLREIWTEGTDDWDIVTWFISEHEDKPDAILTASDVAIPQDELRAGGFRLKSNRDKLLCLAQRLAEEGLADRILCIVDRDRPDLPDRSSPSVVYTDFRDMEMYLWDERPLDKFFSVGCHIKCTGREALTMLRPPLRDMCAVVDTNDALNLQLSFIKWRKYLSRDTKNRTLTFNLKGYVHSYTRAGSAGNMATFMCEVDRRRNLPGDDRMHIRGHTFLETLAKFLSDIAEIPEPTCGHLCRSLFASVERQWLTDFPLFQTMIAFLTPASEASRTRSRSREVTRLSSTS